MSFTELVFEVRDDRYPLARLTATRPRCHGVCRVIDYGSQGSVRALVTLTAPVPQVEELVRELRASRPFQQMDVLSVTRDTVTILVQHPIEPAVGVAPVEHLSRSLGSGMIVEPVLFRDGAARVRVVLPYALEPQRALPALRQAQERGGWRDFRVLRAEEMEPARYVSLLRRVLTPEQEDLLRLSVSLGYYDTPKRATLETIASQLGLSVSPVHKRLKAIESVLMAAYVQPGSERGAMLRRRRKHQAPPFEHGVPVDVTVRARLGNPVHHPLAAAREATALFHPLRATATEASALLVLRAPEETTARFLASLRAEGALHEVGVVGRSRDHVAVEIRAPRDGPLASRTALACFAFAFEKDVLPRPILVEGEEAHLRFFLLEPTSTEGVERRVAELAKACGWSDHEIVSARVVGERPGDVTVPPPERLTQRQEEVLKIAHALGYYRTPRACTLESVAKTLGVSANAIHKNLAAAEFGIVTTYLNAGL